MFATSVYLGDMANPTRAFKHRPLTSSNHVENPHSAGTFYFAYGTNLSPTQMALRCTASPTRSALPLAIARLRGWKWIICHRGCANVVYSGKIGDGGDEVWGVVYDMAIEDEEILDRYEGVDWAAPEAVGDSSPLSRGWGADDHRERPTEQGIGHHNKAYLEVEIVEWKVKSWEERLGRHGVGVLVYVDEYRVEEGPVRESYIGRMNRGIREALDLGLSAKWFDEFVRPFIPEGVEAPEGFVGQPHNIS